MRPELKFLIEVYQKNRNERKEEYHLVFEEMKPEKIIGDEGDLIKKIIKDEYSSGKTDREIGEMLNIKLSTVTYHRNKTFGPKKQKKIK